MQYVNIDESGDPGRSRGSSRFVVGAAIAVDDERKLERGVRKVWTRKRHSKDAQELHAAHSSDSEYRKLPYELSRLGCTITILVVDKISVTSNLEKTYYKVVPDMVRLYPNSRIITVDEEETVKKRIQVMTQLGLEDVFDQADVQAISKLVEHMELGQC